MKTLAEVYASMRKLHPRKQIAILKSSISASVDRTSLFSDAERGKLKSEISKLIDNAFDENPKAQMEDKQIMAEILNSYIDSRYEIQFDGHPFTGQFSPFKGPKRGEVYEYTDQNYKELLLRLTHTFKGDDNPKVLAFVKQLKNENNVIVIKRFIPL